MNPSVKNSVLQKLYYLISIFIGAGCTQANAPTDQLIKGPFTITTEWQTFTFDQSLQTLPLPQSFELLLRDSDFEISQQTEVKKNGLGRYFSKKSDNSTIKAEIILLNKNYEDFHTSYHSIGTNFFPSGNKKSMGYGLYGNDGILYFPEDLEFTAVKIKANTTFNVDAFYWVTPKYDQAPNRKWNDIHPSKVVKLNKKDKNEPDNFSY